MSLQKLPRGMIGLVQDGDIINIDVDKYTIEVELDPEEIQKRRDNFKPKVKERVPQGYLLGALREKILFGALSWEVAFISIPGFTRAHFFF